MGAQRGSLRHGAALRASPGHPTRHHAEALPPIRMDRRSDRLAHSDLRLLEAGRDRHSSPGEEALLSATSGVAQASTGSPVETVANVPHDPQRRAGARHSWRMLDSGALALRIRCLLESSHAGLQVSNALLEVPMKIPAFIEDSGLDPRVSAHGHNRLQSSIGSGCGRSIESVQPALHGQACMSTGETSSIVLSSYFSPTFPLISGSRPPGSYRAKLPSPAW